MGVETAISWADHTFNPWMGCTKVSPACDGCYAEALMDTRYGRVSWGPGQERVRTSTANWRQPLAWDRAAAKAGTRPFVFCASLADVFDNEVDPAWRRDLFDLIASTPNLVWLLLTKRVGNVMKMVVSAGGLPANAAIGATLPNQAEYDRDAPKLSEVRRHLDPLFTFGSFGPLLGPVVLDENAPDWIISEGETDQGGHKARPTHPGWFRGLRDGAARLGRAYQHKQNGEWVPCRASGGEWPIDAGSFIRLRSDGTRGQDGWPMQRVGKRAAGRLLDGATHDARPEVRS